MILQLSFIDIKTYYSSYNNATYFDLYKTFLDSVYRKKWDLLFDLNFQTLNKVFDWLDIKTDVVLESELNVSGMSSERLLDICKKTGATEYLSGPGGKRYLNEKLFKENNIKINFQNYKSITYPQKLSKVFISNLSIIDLLVNVGSESGKLLRESS